VPKKKQTWHVREFTAKAQGYVVDLGNGHCIINRPGYGISPPRRMATAECKRRLLRWAKEDGYTPDGGWKTRKA